MTHIPGALALFQEQIVPLNTNSIIFGTNISVNRDRMYVLRASIVNNSGLLPANYAIFFNGDVVAINYSTVIILGTGGAATSATNNNSIISGLINNGSIATFLIYIFNDTFSNIFESHENTAIYVPAEARLAYGGHIVGQADCTSINISTPTANAIGAGSIFQLYRVTPF